MDIIKGDTAELLKDPTIVDSKDFQYRIVVSINGGKHLYKDFKRICSENFAVEIARDYYKIFKIEAKVSN